MTIGGAQSIFPGRRSLLANYDWVDLVDASGYVLFYGVCLPDSSGKDYFLIRSNNVNTMFGTAKFGNDESLGDDQADTSNISTQGVGDGATEQKCIDLDFDLTPFNLPKQLRGTAIVRCGVWLNSAANNDAIYVVARLRKWDGSSETEIASTQSEDLQILASNPTEWSITLPITVPRTHFKAGEQVRLTLEVWTYDTISSTEEVQLAHDPRDTAITNFTAGNTAITLLVPFIPIID